MLICLDRYIGGPDQRELVLIWDHENDPVVGVLQDVCVCFLMDTRDDDVAPLHVSYPRLGRLGADFVLHLLHPRSRGVDERSRADLPRLAARLLQGYAPMTVFAAARDQLGVGANVRAFLARGDGVDDDQACVVHARVGVDKATVEGVLQSCAPFAGGELHAEGRRQALAAAEVVIEK